MSEGQHHTLVCSVLFVDIEGYSKRSVTEQLAIKQEFNALLVAALSHVATDDRIILDTGDGAAVSFLSDPEDSLFAAMSLRDAIAAKDPALRVRIGINLGPVRLLKDINGQTNIIGDGINDAQRVMSFAEPGKILVSRSYFEVVSRLSDDYARLFVYDGTRTDKHVREHAVYAIGATTPEPPHDFATKTATVEAAPQNIAAAPAKFVEPPVTAPVPPSPGKGRPKWIAIAAVVILVPVGIGVSLWLGRGNAPKEVPAPPTVPPVEQKAASTSPPEPAKAAPRKPVERKDSPAPKAQSPKPPESTKPVEVRKDVQSTPAWLIEMRNKLSACSKQDIVRRGICSETVRWKYCAPSHWDEFDECKVVAGKKPTSP